MGFAADLVADILRNGVCRREPAMQQRKRVSKQMTWMGRMGNNRKPSVLVVDDDRMMREMLKLILQSEDYPVVGEASCGRIAVELCAKLKPDLVLLDIRMPEMDGLQVLDEIRKVSPATKAIMVSAEPTVDRVNEAVKKGAAGFVVKPLNAAGVIDRIESCFRRGDRDA